jgi:hypothetical protein
MPLANALHEAIENLKEEFGADDDIMARMLRILAEGFAYDTPRSGPDAA